MTRDEGLRELLASELETYAARWWGNHGIELGERSRGKATSVVSRKRIAGSNFNQEAQVAAGAVFYLVRLELTPNGGVGAVFDGAQPGPLFRAAVRDQYGDKFVGQSDFGIGKLEIR